MNDLKLHSWPYFVGYKTRKTIHIYIYIYIIDKNPKVATDISTSWWYFSQFASSYMSWHFNFTISNLILPKIIFFPPFLLYIFSLWTIKSGSPQPKCATRYSFYQQNIRTYITSFSSQSNKQFTNQNNTLMQNSNQNNKRKIEEHNS